MEVRVSFLTAGRLPNDQLPVVGGVLALFVRVSVSPFSAEFEASSGNYATQRTLGLTRDGHCIMLELSSRESARLLLLLLLFSRRAVFVFLVVVVVQEWICCGFIIFTGVA